MRKYLQTHLQIASYLIIVAVSISAGAGYARYINHEMESRVQAQIDTQEVYMYALAEMTDRNAADEEVDAIVKDCGRRDEYERLLMNLGTLSKKDLVVMQGLFESCGNFYAERKALMVSKLDRELKAYRELNDYMKLLNKKNTDLVLLETWGELVTLEKARSSFLNEQTQLQSKIISELISGNNPSSESVVALARDAQDINELLLVHDQRIDGVRKVLQK